MPPHVDSTRIRGYWQTPKRSSQEPHLPLHPFDLMPVPLHHLSPLARSSSTLFLPWFHTPQPHSKRFTRALPLFKRPALGYRRLPRSHPASVRPVCFVWSLVPSCFFFSHILVTLLYWFWINDFSVLPPSLAIASIAMTRKRIAVRQILPDCLIQYCSDASNVTCTRTAEPHPSSDLSVRACVPSSPGRSLVLPCCVTCECHRRWNRGPPSLSSQTGRRWGSTITAMPPWPSLT
jgi:hypothetical protein